MSESYGFDEDDTRALQESSKSDEEMASEFIATFSTPSGELVLTYLSNYCHQVSSCYVPGDSSATAYLCGRRDVMLTILRYLTMDDLQIIQLSREQAQRKER